MADLPISVILPPAVALVLGFGLGWAVREVTLEREVSHRAVTTGLAILISLIWMVSVFAAIDSPEYSTPTGLHAIMGAVAGFFFKGGGILDGGRGRSSNDTDD